MPPVSTLGLYNQITNGWLQDRLDKYPTNGETVETLTSDLNNAGIPVSARTVYRWIEQTKEKGR